MDCTALIGWIPLAVQYPSAAQWEHNTVQGHSAYSLGLNTGTKQWPLFRKSIRQNQAASDQPAVTTGWALVARWSGGLFSSYVFRFRKGVELWIFHVDPLWQVRTFFNQAIALCEPLVFFSLSRRLQAFWLIFKH
jgi:hypothetical protein